MILSLGGLVLGLSQVGGEGAEVYVLRDSVTRRGLPLESTEPLDQAALLSLEGLQLCRTDPEVLGFSFPAP